ncbi:MAG: LamG domain-containing protein [Victivallaceae bacterium]|nr:LamG domain-containing protein [Victivallaceae bacterium]
MSSRILTPNHYPVNREGLVLWFDSRNSGSVSTGIVKDCSGKKNNGTLYNDCYIDQNGIHFDGDTDYIVIPMSSSLSFSGSAPITLSVFIKLATTNLATNPNLITSGGYPWLYLTGTNRIAVYFNADSQVSSVLSWSTLPWYHITAKKDSSGNWAIYRDSELVGSGSGASISYSSTYGVNIGSDRGTSGNYFNGIMNNIQIYNRSLSAGEGKANYLKNMRG